MVRPSPRSRSSAGPSGRGEAEDARLQPTEATAQPGGRDLKVDDAAYGLAAQLTMRVEQPARGPRDCKGSHSDVEPLVRDAEISDDREDRDALQRTPASPPLASKKPMY